MRFYFKSGERLGGFYGENSFSTSFPNTQQIYVEEIYELDEQGRFPEQDKEAEPNNGGAIINREDCQYIEFLEVPEAEDSIDASNESEQLRKWQNIMTLLGLGKILEKITSRRKEDID